MEINPSVVFCIKNRGDFTYSMYVYDSNGYKILEKEITRSLNFETNTEHSYIKWLDIGAEIKIVEVRFDRYDAILSVKFAIQECIYEMTEKKNMRDAIAEEDRTYLENMQKEPPKIDTKIIEVYKDPGQLNINKDKVREITTMVESNFKGLEKYEDKRVLTQAKIADCSIVSLANHL